jgi:hypothetical protein
LGKIAKKSRQKAAAIDVHRERSPISGAPRAFAHNSQDGAWRFTSNAGDRQMSSTLLEDAAVENLDWAMVRARSGAAWLDSKFGSEWDRRIDFERLEIGSPVRCILGQLIIHGYLSLLFATQIVDHGFSRGLLDLLVVLLPIGPVKRAYRPLTDAWKTVLRERRGQTEPHAIRPGKKFGHDKELQHGDFTRAA